MKALKKYRWPLTGALLGVLVFLAVYGVRVLDPTSVDWILNSLSQIGRASCRERV